MLPYEERIILVSEENLLFVSPVNLSISIKSKLKNWRMKLFSIFVLSKSIFKQKIKLKLRILIEIYVNYSAEYSIQLN